MLTSPQRRLLREADIDKRRLERQSVHGDEEAQLKELIMKMRNGELTQEQVKLLSYLSYKPAQLLIPVEPPSGLKEFVKGLGRDREVFIRVAIISARSVLHIYEKVRPDDDRPRRAIEAVSRMGVDPGDVADAAYAAYVADTATATVTSFAGAASNAAAWAASMAVTYGAAAASTAARAADAAADADPSLDVRGIIEKELIDWMLQK